MTLLLNCLCGPDDLPWWFNLKPFSHLPNHNVLLLLPAGWAWLSGQVGALGSRCCSGPAAVPAQGLVLYKHWTEPGKAPPTPAAVSSCPSLCWSDWVHREVTACSCGPGTVIGDFSYPHKCQFSLSKEATIKVFIPAYLYSDFYHLFIFCI